MNNTNKIEDRNIKDKKASCIKLGIDTHLREYRVVRMIERNKPQAAQRFGPREFLAYAEKQKELAEKVYCIYEAGPFGYELERELKARGIECIVVAPQNWDERHLGVKTDKRDALELVLRLDRYLNGHQKTISVVRVPSKEIEQLRMESRFRGLLLRQRQRYEAQGRSMLHYLGKRWEGVWWKESVWIKLKSDLSGSAMGMMETIRGLLLELEEKVRAVTRQIEKAEGNPLPVGVGKLSMQQLDREMKDWGSYRNRKEVGAYTGLCPGVRGSGMRIITTGVTKHGNTRVRTILVEMAWRMMRYQPSYRWVQKWEEVMRKGSGSQRKKAIVAIARHLAVDLWRIRTGKMKPEEVGMVMA